MLTSCNFRVDLSCFFFLGILLLPLPAFPQTSLVSGDTLSQQQFIQGCARYRQNVIHDIENALSDFALLADGLSETSSNPAAHIALRDAIIQATLHEEHEGSKSSALNAIRKLAENDSMALRLYEYWLGENYFALNELQFLVGNQILDPKPPYKLGALRDIWQEFSFYGLRANMVVADIGAGNGVISIILHESGLPLDLILTEIDDDFLQLLEGKISRFRDENPKGTLQLVKGSEKTLGLPQSKVDLMIFREVYHHLKHPKPILADILNYLDKDGYVVLIEGTRDSPDPDYKPCSQAITYKQIIKEWTAAGYILAQQKVVDGSFLLKFKRSL